MRSERVRITVEIGLTIALAAVLNTLKLWHMPQGGTVSLGMLPLFILAVRRGLGVGILAGALYGVLDYFVDPYVVHWVQALLDYPVAYAGVGVAGVAAGAWMKAVRRGTVTTALWTVALPAFLLGAACRYLAHVVSGYVFFSEFAGDQPVLLYSALYNLYVPISTALCFYAALVLLPVLSLAEAAPTTSSAR
ncbi:MAG: energy-coupled thiamine transporter ThiT [Coriobacteriia bacterium]|nr:energy-coupled thiamine transporter ThiT [Coriobacteriia bacterium]